MSLKVTILDFKDNSYLAKNMANGSTLGPTSTFSKFFVTFFSRFFLILAGNRQTLKGG